MSFTSVSKEWWNTNWNIICKLPMERRIDVILLCIVKSDYERVCLTSHKLTTHLWHNSPVRVCMQIVQHQQTIGSIYLWHSVMKCAEDRTKHFLLDSVDVQGLLGSYGQRPLPLVTLSSSRTNSLSLEQNTQLLSINHNLFNRRLQTLLVVMS